MKNKPADLTSFVKTKEALQKKMWAWIPERLKLPLVAVVGLVLMAGTTRSTWYPVLDSLIHPPVQHVVVGFQILAAEGRVLADSEAQLMDRQDQIVATASTDAMGFVTFNLSTKDRIAALRCRGQSGGKVSIALEARAVLSGKTIRINLAKMRAEYEN